MTTSSPQRGRHRAAYPAAIFLDLLILLSGTAVLAILVTGGGQYRIGDVRISMRTVGNPLLLLQAAILLRLGLLRTIPFLGIPRYRLTDADAIALNWMRRLGTVLENMTAARAVRTVVASIVVVTCVKLANACFYPGFFSGDDVEIHEMTFARLFALDWPVWNIRSPFYPLVFVYPVQALLVRLGETDTETLVFAGRAGVAVISSLAVWLTYRVGVALGHAGAGVAAAVILGMHRLHVVFGGSELPRPVAAVFVLAAFACLLSPHRRTASTALAGAFLGIAASLRFSEFVFLAPALVSLGMARRFRDGGVLVLVFGLTVLLVLGVGDLLYWGEPFFSFANVFHYTIVAGLSSRGYEPLHYYVSALHSWTSIPIVLLALYGLTSKGWHAGLWWLIPLGLLMLFPHKEPRYLVPVLPFLSLTAGFGLVRLLGALRAASVPPWGVDARRVALVAVVLCAGAVVFEVGGWRFRKPAAPLAVARHIADAGCRGGVAFEQLWRGGGRLYMRRCSLLSDLDPDRLRDRSYLARELASPTLEWVVVRRPPPDGVEADLAAAGFRGVAVHGASDYFIGRRDVAR